MNTPITKQILFIFSFCFLLTQVAFSQKIKIQEGDFSELKSTKAVKLVFDYSDMGVGKYDREEDYLNDKVKDKNKDEKGSGDEWKAKWIADREERFQPKFVELFEKYLGEKIKISDDADMVLKVHTTFTEPGFNIGIARRPAMINVKLSTHKADQMLSEMTMDKVPGSDAMGYDFDTGYRISEAYAKTAKAFAKHINKKVLK